MEKRTGFKHMLSWVAVYSFMAKRYRLAGRIDAALKLEAERDRLSEALEKAGYGNLAFAAEMRADAEMNAA